MYYVLLGAWFLFEKMTYFFSWQDSANCPKYIKVQKSHIQYPICCRASLYFLAGHFRGKSWRNIVLFIHKINDKKIEVKHVERDISLLLCNFLQTLNGLDQRGTWTFYNQYGEKYISMKCLNNATSKIYADTISGHGCSRIRAGDRGFGRERFFHWELSSQLEGLPGPLKPWTYKVNACF